MSKNIDEDLNKSVLISGQDLVFFLGSLLLFTGAAVLLFKTNVIPWPFHGSETVSGTYKRILFYFPLTVFSLLSVIWILKKDPETRNCFSWNRFSYTFFLGLLISAVYSFYLFFSCTFALKGLSFIPPALILSMLNALSEELIFRLVLFRILIALTGSWHRSNFVQAGLYAFPHFFIGGGWFFIYAAIYGLLLGGITHTNKSILPAIICHFIIDIGAVALPLLIII